MLFSAPRLLKLFYKFMTCRDLWDSTTLPVVSGNSLVALVPLPHKRSQCVAVLEYNIILLMLLRWGLWSACAVFTCIWGRCLYNKTCVGQGAYCVPELVSRFVFKNKICWTILGFRRFLLAMTISPALEKFLSQRTEVYVVFNISAGPLTWVNVCLLNTYKQKKKTMI